MPAGICFVHTDFITKFVDRDDPVAGPRHRAKYGRLAPRFLDGRARSIAYLIGYYPTINYGEPPLWNGGLEQGCHLGVESSTQQPLVA